MSNCREVRSFGKESSDKAVCVFIGSALSGWIRIGEIYFHSGFVCELVVVCHFSSVVVCHFFLNSGCSFFIVFAIAFVTIFVCFDFTGIIYTNRVFFLQLLQWRFLCSRPIIRSLSQWPISFRSSMCVDIIPIRLMSLFCFYSLLFSCSAFF